MPGKLPKNNVTLPLGRGHNYKRNIFVIRLEGETYSHYIMIMVTNFQMQLVYVDVIYQNKLTNPVVTS